MMEEQMLLEMADFGSVNGIKVIINSDAHNPPHFHFGKAKIKLLADPPKNVTEVRSHIIIGGDTVKDADLTKLVKFLKHPYSKFPAVSVYTMLNVFLGYLSFSK